MAKKTPLMIFIISFLLFFILFPSHPISAKDCPCKNNLTSCDSQLPSDCEPNEVCKCEIKASDPHSGLATECQGTCVTPTPSPKPKTPLQTEDGAIDFKKITEEVAPTLGLKSQFLPESGSNLAGIITIILPYLFVIAGLLLFFYLLYGGFHMMIAAGNEKGLAEAKGKITNALIGFLLLFISYWLVQIIEVILGIKIF